MADIMPYSENRSRPSRAAENDPNRFEKNMLEPNNIINSLISLAFPENRAIMIIAINEKSPRIVLAVRDEAI
jgi:hypothetical protein